MQPRKFNQAGLSALGMLILTTYQQAHALSLGDLTNAEASSGLKKALEKGALAAIALLGKTDGFLGNPKVRIPLPGYIEDASKILKNFGQGKRIDELVTPINRAAEAAVPMGRDLLVSAVRSMNVNDANLQQYVTGKSLDGLYLIIGEEEKKIRQDPVGTGSAILKRVFGAMK